jgi:hypothetical protein
MDRRQLYFCFAISAVLASACLAGDSAMDRATLRGLKAVKVIVDPPSPEIERQGVDREQLRGSIERKLRDDGIKVDDNAIEFVGLSIASVATGRRSTLSIKKGPVSLTVGLGVYQIVTLNRDPTTKTVAETWGDQRIMSAVPKGLEQELSGAVDDLVEQFVKAYRTVNPR